MSFNRILLAVDSSPVAAHAATVGADLARALGAEVALIHVVNPPDVVAPDSGILASEQVKLAQQDGQRLLATFRQRMVQGAVSPLEFVVVGQPASEIVKSAGEWPADVIVIGSHGRKGLSRVLLGSVAEAVLRHAPCSVLVVRAKE